MMKDKSELFELCRRVYEATVWGDTEKYYEERFVNGELYALDICENTGYKDDGKEFSTGGDAVIRNHTPLYTSDYLLERLQQSLKHKNDQITVFNDSKGWSAKLNINFIDGDDIYHYREVNDSYGHATPLLALLKLTIKLHEEELI